MEEQIHSPEFYEKMEELLSLNKNRECLSMNAVGTKMYYLELEGKKEEADALLKDHMVMWKEGEAIQNELVKQTSYEIFSREWEKMLKKKCLEACGKKMEDWHLHPNHEIESSLKECKISVMDHLTKCKDCTIGLAGRFLITESFGEKGEFAYKGELKWFKHCPECGCGFLIKEIES